MPSPPLPSGRLLGVDYGSKRVGLAISDPEGRFALPLGVVARKDDRGVARRIVEIVRREEIAGLVVGEPRRLDGTRGDAAQRVARFARRLETATDLPVALVDESLTSVEAERRLRSAGVAADPGSGRVDAVAAQILLQEALDRRRAEGGVG